MYKTLYCLLILILPQSLLAQHSYKNVFIIDSFNITGNIHTDSLIIIGELPIKIGQEIEQKNAFYYLDEIHNRLMRTSLFTHVTASINSVPGKENHIIINIIAHEKPRIYVLPEIDFYDRNVNVWWVEHHHELSRIIGGINIHINNLFGEAHSLTFTSYFGALNSYALVYLVPYANTSHTLSFKGGLNLTRQRIVNFETVNNKQDFLYSPYFQRHYTKAFMSMGHRISYTWKQNLELNYYYDAASSTVIDSNNLFYTTGLKHIRYADINYTISHDNRNNQDYALKGHLLSLSGGYLQGLSHSNISYPHADAGIYYYIPLNEKLNMSLISRGTARFSNKLPYPLQKALGYKEDYISGYEYYVVDGSSYWINKAALKYVLFNRTIKTVNLLNKSFETDVPVMLLPKIYFEEGYVVNTQNTSPTNTLANTFLPGWGAGIDAVVYYDINLRFEYSFNNQKHHSLFLHFKSVF